MAIYALLFFSLAVERSDLAKDIKTIYECLCRNGEIRQGESLCQDPDFGGRR